MKKLAIAALLIGAGAYITADACTRVVYAGTQDIVMVGRTLDWKNPIPTNLYVYPQGINKQSMDKGPRLTWKSKYGSVLAVSYDGGVTEGMNERGLVMNGLFCKNSIYFTPEDSPHEVPVMSLAMLVSYFLDNFATVEEVDTWLKGNEFAISGQTFDGGTVSKIHWGITDVTGDNLVMEYENGKLNVYRGTDLKVLTNDPTFEDMQAINNYWKAVGGTNMLPGTVRSADRFARASFFISHVPDNYDANTAWGSLNSIMGTVSVPYGYLIQGEPNVSSTQWTSIADATGGKYYFRFADNKGAFWIDLGRLRMNPGAPILKLDTSSHLDFSGDINSHLVETDGFTPMY